MDGVRAVSPLSDPVLAKLRPRRAMTAPTSDREMALINLDGTFGLYPALAPLASLYREGRLAIVQGVGSPNLTRPHFDAQDYMQNQTPGRKGTPSGWLNRAVGLLGHEGTPFHAVSMTKALPRSLYGDELAIAIANLRDFNVQFPSKKRPAQNAGKSFETLYKQTSQELLRNTGRESFEAIDMLSEVRKTRYRPGNDARYR